MCLVNCISRDGLGRSRARGDAGQVEGPHEEPGVLERPFSESTFEELRMTLRNPRGSDHGTRKGSLLCGGWTSRSCLLPPGSEEWACSMSPSYQERRATECS